MDAWYRFGRAFVRSLLKIYNGLKVIGVENVPSEGGALFVCNHISHLDPPAVGVSSPRKVRFVAKEELFHQFFLSWYLPTVGVIPIKRGSGGNIMLEKAEEAIRAGDIVVMFPEGTRSRTGLPGKARTGFLILTARTLCPIIPIRISGSFDCMPPGSRFPKPGKIQVAFGKPIQYNPGELDLNNRQQLVSEAQRVMDIIVSLPGWFPKRARHLVESSSLTVNSNNNSTQDE